MASEQSVLLEKLLRIQHDGKNERECRVVLTSDCLAWSVGETDEKVEVRVSWLLKTEVSESTTDKDESQYQLIVHYAVRGPTRKPDNSSDLSLTSVTFMGTREACQELARAIQTELPKKVPNRPKRLLIIINPVSGKGKGQQVYTDKVAPIFQLCGIQADVKVTQRAKHSDEILEKFDLTQVDGVIAVGGDGTFTEVVSALLRRTMTDAGKDQNSPEVRPETPSPICSLISAGSGNGHPLYAGFSRDPRSSALMIAIGHSQLMDVNTIHCGNTFIAYMLLLLGYGQMSRVMEMMENNRWAGPARYLALPFCLLIRRGIIDVEVEYLPAEKSGSTSDGNSTAQEDPCKQGETMERTSGSSWKSISGTFFGVDAVTIQPFEPNNGLPGFQQLSLNDGLLRLWLTKPCGRLQQIQFFNKLKKCDHTAFSADYLQTLEVKAYRIRAGGSFADTTTARVIVWDGDIIRSAEPHIEVRAHQSVLKIFTRDDGEELRRQYLGTKSSGTEL